MFILEASWCRLVFISTKTSALTEGLSVGPRVKGGVRLQRDEPREPCHLPTQRGSRSYGLYRGICAKKAARHHLHQHGGGESTQTNLDMSRKTQDIIKHHVAVDCRLTVV